MRWYRYLPIVLTVGGVFLLAGALRGPSSRTTASASSADPRLAALESVAPDAAAFSLVDQALVHLDDPAREYLRTSIWMQSHVPGLSYQAEGIYLTAPGKRYRLELRTRREKKHAREASESMSVDVGVGSEPVTPGGLRETQQEPSKSMPSTSSKSQPARMAGGPEPLLRGLHAQVKWVRHDVQGEDVVITGVWKDELRSQLLAADRSWPACMPRGCRLWLRGGERWPARLEYWGPAKVSGPDRLLVEIEFRDPSWNRPLTEEECLHLFRAEPVAGIAR